MEATGDGLILLGGATRRHRQYGTSLSVSCQRFEEHSAPCTTCDARAKPDAHQCPRGMALPSSFKTDPPPRDDLGGFR